MPNIPVPDHIANLPSNKLSSDGKLLLCHLLSETKGGKRVSLDLDELLDATGLDMDEVADAIVMLGQAGFAENKSDIDITNAASVQLEIVVRLRFKAEEVNGQGVLDFTGEKRKRPTGWDEFDIEGETFRAIVSERADEDGVFLTITRLSDEHVAVRERAETWEEAWKWADEWAGTYVPSADLSEQIAARIERRCEAEAEEAGIG
jgi:hypothetical protein